MEIFRLTQIFKVCLILKDIQELQLHFRLFKDFFISKEQVKAISAAPWMRLDMFLGRKLKAC